MRNKSMIILAALTFCLTFSVSMFAGDTLTEGAELGKWTMDYDSAMKLAKDKNLPVMVQYTGSDWCVWCKVMDKNVFSKDEFYKFASKNIVLVKLDFPRDTSLVPEKYQVRNKELLQANGVQGFPTYVVLKADGKTELGRLGAGRDKTVESFVKEIQDVIN